MTEKSDVNALDMLKGAVDGEPGNTSSGGAEKNASPVVDGGTKAGDVKDNGMIPRSRYNEAVAKLETATKDWTTEKVGILSQLQEAQKSVANLSDLVKGAQQDRDLVAALKALSKDPKYTDLITKVDNALQGIDEDEEVGKATSKEASVSRKQVMDELRGELDERFVEQKHTFISSQVDILAKQYLERLPAEYNEADKTVISEMWANRVDWDSLEKEPGKLPAHLSETLQKTLNDYGVPRGKLASQKAEIQDTQQQQSKTPTAEEQVRGILDRDWGKLKTIKDSKGNETSVPEASEEEFNQAFGKLFKSVVQR